MKFADKVQVFPSLTGPNATPLAGRPRDGRGRGQGRGTRDGARDGDVTQRLSGRPRDGRAGRQGRGTRDGARDGDVTQRISPAVRGTAARDARDEGRGMERGTGIQGREYSNNSSPQLCLRADRLDTGLHGALAATPNVRVSRARRRHHRNGCVATLPSSQRPKLEETQRLSASGALTSASDALTGDVPCWLHRACTHGARTSWAPLAGLRMCRRTPRAP